MKQAIITVPIVLSLLACSAPKSNKTSEEMTTKEVATEAPAKPALPAHPDGATQADSRNVLRLEGLGPLKIGEPVPANSGWGERGAQQSDACRTVTSPAHPGVYAIVEGGKVRRITAGKGSGVTLAEGIGVGASEAEVRRWFAGFREEPHKYEAAPAKYLTAPNAKSGDSALRIEIGQDDKIRAIHIGTMPTLAYVEGCA